MATNKCAKQVLRMVRKLQVSDFGSAAVENISCAPARAAQPSLQYEEGEEQLWTGLVATVHVRPFITGQDGHGASTEHETTDGAKGQAWHSYGARLKWADCHVVASGHLQLILQRAQPVVVMASHLLQLTLQLPHPPAPVLLAPTPAHPHD